MVADVPFWQKLWNRGVDVAASVIASSITAAIIAIIATFTWRWKRNRDLHFEEDKQRQHQRLADEFAKQERQRVAGEQHDALSQQRENLAAAMLEAEADSILIKEVWWNYVLWVKSILLNYLAGNKNIPNEHINIKTMTHGDHTQLRRELADLILRTELPQI